MRISNIKVIFQTKVEKDVISWENHVNEIINGVEKGTSCKYKVYMINPMPIAEMDNVIKELCNTIEYRLNTVAKYHRDAECVAFGYLDMLSAVTYYIELE